jgi:shikimate kinase
MEIFTINEEFYSDREGEMVETGKILGYKVVAPNGKILGQGETEQEAMEKALTVAYLSESNENTYEKIKRKRRLFSKKVAKVS